MPTKAVQFKIILKGTTPVVWRRIQVLENSSLRTLQYAICDVMAWKYMHLYMFKIDAEQYGDPEYDYDLDGWLDDSKNTIKKIIKKNTEFEFIYDFGDYWEHQIVFEDVCDVKVDERYPVCLAGENAAPPDDCGGPHGFEEFKKAVANPKDGRHQEFTDWYKLWDRRPFDSNFFDMEWVNDVKLGRRRKLNSVKSQKSPKVKK